MNKTNLKRYAPQARKDFIATVTARANVLGLSEGAGGHIQLEPAQVQGDVAARAHRPRVLERLLTDTAMETEASATTNLAAAVPVPAPDGPDIDALLNRHFAGKVVRKDLTKLIKEGANVPVYVLEYLLGMYCASDDEATIQAGLVTVKRILAENYVRPDEAEKVKSKIRETGTFTTSSTCGPTNGAGEKPRQRCRRALRGRYRCRLRA
jgi:hypothetical protein